MKTFDLDISEKTVAELIHQLKTTFHNAGWNYKSSNELDWGYQQHEGEEGYCYLCGLEKHQICFHSRTDYVNIVSDLINTDPSAAYSYSQQMYADVLETLRNLPEKHDLAKKPPHTFFSKKYNDWLKSLKD